MNSLHRYLVFFISLVILSQTSETFVDSNIIHSKGGSFYYPNTGIIPQGSTITKIGMSIGGQLDRIVVYYKTPLNNTYMIDGFGSSTRQIRTYYQVPDGNVIHTIRFGTYISSNGEKNFIGIQFIGTTDTSPYFLGSFSSKITKSQYIYLDHRPVAFFGYIQTQYRSICGFGVVMAKPNGNLEKIDE